MKAVRLRGRVVDLDGTLNLQLFLFNDFWQAGNRDFFLSFWRISAIQFLRISAIQFVKLTVYSCKQFSEKYRRKILCIFQDQRLSKLKTGLDNQSTICPFRFDLAKPPVIQISLISKLPFWIVPDASKPIDQAILTLQFYSQSTLKILQLHRKKGKQFLPVSNVKNPFCPHPLFKKNSIILLNLISEQKLV